MINKFLTLQSIRETASRFQELFDKSGNPVWKQALQDIKLEYAMVVKIPDDDDFMLNHAKFLVRSGLFEASEKRLANFSCPNRKETI